MSLYNMLHGVNPASGLLLGLAGFDSVSDVGRFRDAYVDCDSGEPLIAIYTRNGGGNRDHWNDEAEEGRECGCTGCTITYALPSLPGYVRDEDDDFDCTYCTVWFRPPAEVADLLAALALPEADRPAQAWADLIESLPKRMDEIPEDGTKGQRTARELIAGLRQS